MYILSCGAGMQSTALALMSCEVRMGKRKYPLVPIYDAVIYCDLGKEPPWVYEQVEFIKRACDNCGIPFYILDTPLYDDYVENFVKIVLAAFLFGVLDRKAKKERCYDYVRLIIRFLLFKNFVDVNLWDIVLIKEQERKT